MLPLVVVSFALNGSLLGVQNISNEILLCQDRPSHIQAAWRVGVAYQIEVRIDQNSCIPESQQALLFPLKCSLSPSALSAGSSSPVFYDICILTLQRQEGRGRGLE